MRRALLLLTAAVTLPACGDGGPLDTSLNPGALHQSLQDGTKAGGNPHFFFLPPLAPQPKASGTVNLRLRPSVEICRLQGTTCASVIASFQTGSGNPSISVVDQHYQVDWNTDVSGVRSGDVVRITVYPRARRSSADVPPPLGFAEVSFSNDARALRASTALRPGQTLPIKFRIEHGAVRAAQAIASGGAPQECNDCVEQVVVSGTEATVTTPNRDAGAFLPANALPQGVGEIIFTINRINPLSTAGPCFPRTPIEGEDPSAVPPQAEGCFEYNTEPFLDTGFANPIKVAVCLDPKRNPDRYALFKYSPHREDRFSQLVSQAPLPVPLTEADCTDFQTSTPVLARNAHGARLLRVARAGWDAVAAPLGRLFGPSLLMATDVVLSGDVILLSPSRIGFGEVLSVTAYDGDGQEALIGTTLPKPATVQVLSGREGHEPVAASGVAVSWAVASGGGSIAGAATATSWTDENGRTSVPWTLGSLLGRQSLTATVPGGVSVTFSATALAPVSVTVSPTSAQLCVAGRQQFTATVSGTTNTGVTWSSSNPTVATVDVAGLATGRSAGMAAIIATSVADPTRSASAAVTVTSCGSAEISSVALSTSVLSIDGDRVPYTATISNSTGATITDASVQTWIVQGSTRRAGGGAKTSCTALGELSPGSCTFSFTLGASNSAAGTGTLVEGAATALFELKSGSTVLHTVQAPVTLVGTPDLIVSAVRDDPDPVFPGSWRITVTAQNIGTGTAYGITPYYLQLYVEGTSTINRAQLDRIEPGATRTMSWIVHQLPPGTHTARATVDPTNAVAETNELNNEKVHLFTVPPPQ